MSTGNCPGAYAFRYRAYQLQNFLTSDLVEVLVVDVEKSFVVDVS